VSAPATNRVIETAMAILQATSHQQLGITVLNKALFYADLCPLRDLGRSLTDSGYIALPQGPVLNHYERALVRDLERYGYAEQLTDGVMKPMIVRRQLADYEHLGDEELGIARLVARKIETKTAAWVSDCSHENLAWQTAFRDSTGAPIDMSLALQQVVEADPWLDEPESEGEVPDALTTAADDDGVPF
jgi:hypothetical protein